MRINNTRLDCDTGNIDYMWQSYNGKSLVKPFISTAFDRTETERYLTKFFGLIIPFEYYLLTKIILVSFLYETTYTFYKW